VSWSYLCNYSVGLGRKKIWEKHPGAQKVVLEKKSGAALPDFPVWDRDMLP
jgi:hypothetical protein